MRPSSGHVLDLEEEPMNIHRLIATAALTSIGLLGLVRSLDAPETRVAAPAETVANVVETLADAPVVGPVVEGAVRPH
jgi:hypothetical protein